MDIAYHSSHEQFAPSELLRYIAMAERSGFTSIHSSDHFHPWSVRQGHSGFSFAWLGAAMQATSLPFSLICAPGQRYHPAIVAQAFATLCELFPGRCTFSLGSGEALNECITGGGWPSKDDRNRRLYESYSVIRQLLNGETVSFRGHVSIENAKLYTLPARLPLLFGAAISEETAGWMGSWCDGLITTGGLDEVKKCLAAFKANGGEGKPAHVQVQLSYAHSIKEAEQGAYDQWRTNVLDSDMLSDLALPEQFDAMATSFTIEDMKKKMLITADVEECINYVKSFMEAGFEKVIVHNVNRAQENFICDFGKRIHEL